MQEHVKLLPVVELNPSKQIEPFLQGTFSQVTNRNTSHCGPAYSSVHSQENPATRSVQDPPFRQGFDMHSSISNSHKSPSYPSRHRQVKLATPSIQVELFVQFAVRHSSMFCEQSSLSYPAGQSQAYFSDGLLQTPPFLQDCWKHRIQPSSGVLEFRWKCGPVNWNVSG